MRPQDECISLFTEAKWLAAAAGDASAAQIYHACAELVAETFKGEPND